MLLKVTQQVCIRKLLRVYRFEGYSACKHSKVTQGVCDRRSLSGYALQDHTERIYSKVIQYVYTRRSLSTYALLGYSASMHLKLIQCVCSWTELVWSISPSLPSKVHLYSHKAFKIRYRSLSDHRSDLLTLSKSCLHCREQPLPIRPKKLGTSQGYFLAS